MKKFNIILYILIEPILTIPILNNYYFISQYYDIIKLR